jgi:methionine-gamma-lyase
MKNANKNFKPETLMMTYGYKPELSEGSLKCPIFQTSTFVFKNAESGKRFFEIAYGLKEKQPTEEMGLIYSRLNNPDVEILENRLCLWDKSEDCAVFESGLAAITTVLLEFLKPGDTLLYSSPLYGGTDHFIKYVLTKFNINIVGFRPGNTQEEIKEIVKKAEAEKSIALVYIETPANPTNALIDMDMCKEIADYYSTPERPVYFAVDNTYMGPLWQHPLEHGADLVLYSATKYIGGHSDVIAGACLGNKQLIGRVKTLRTFLGNMTSPYVGWLLMRSLETLKVRMDCQTVNAQKVAEYLNNHEKVEKVYYLGLIKENDPEYTIYKKQCKAPGAMVSFDIKGGEKEAFKFLDNLSIITLAVSLGGTESLAEHPATMTHADVSYEDKQQMHITEKLVRLSIGVENVDDIIYDIEQALQTVNVQNYETA